MLVFALYAHFFHRVWRQERPDVCLNWPIESRNYDSVSNFQHTVDQDDVDRRPVTLNNLHLEHCALKNILLRQLLAFGGLAHLA